MIPIRGAPARQVWPWVTVGLIAINVAVFLYMMRIGPDRAMTLFMEKGAVPAKLSQLKFWFSGNAWQVLATMFSALFLHAGWVHLIGNMWFLWVFGEALEDDLGHWRYLAFYLCMGFFSGLIYVLAASRLESPLVGASGAIAGVLGGYLVRLPQAPIRTLFPFRLKIETVFIPAFVWLAIWLALQFYGLRQGGTVAWMAHLGGFFTGLVTVGLFTPLRPEPVPGGRKKAAAGRRKRR